MNRNIDECDWKAFRGFKDSMLEELTKRINDRAVEILNSKQSATAKYDRLFEHVNESNQVIARCFDDWKRSNLIILAANLRREGLVPQELWDQLSDMMKDRLEILANQGRINFRRKPNKQGWIAEPTLLDRERSGPA